MGTNGWPLAPTPSNSEFVTNGVFALLTLALTTGAVLLSARDRLERVRIDSWNTEWAVVEPEWSRRR